MKFNLFIIIIVCFAVNLSAQQSTCSLTLAGRITDIQHEEPLGFATIFIAESHTATQSDENGKFEINNLCQGNYTLIISHIGCAQDTFTVNLFQNQFNEYRLDHKDENLETITIKEQVNNYKSTLTTEYIDGKALETLSGKTLGAALKEITGVNSIQTGNSISKPVIHGLHSNRVLIVNNGVRQEGQQWGNEHGPEIDPFIANKFTVIKGAAGVKYGSDAMGGVILVDAADMPDSVGATGSIQLVGLSNTLGGAASAMLQSNLIKHPTLSWRLQGTVKREGSVKTPNYYLVNTAYAESNYSATASYKKQDFTTEIYYSYFHTKTGIFAASHIGNLTDLENAFVSETPLITGDFSYAIARPYQLISHHLIKSKTFYHSDKLGHFTFTAAYQNNIRSEYDSHVSLDDSIAALNLPSLYFEIGTITSNLDWEHHKWHNFTGTFGVSGMNQQNITQYSTFIPNFKNYAGGVYGMEKYQYANWIFEAGLRYDYKWMKIFMYDDGNFVTPEHQYQNVSWNLGTTWFDKKHTSVNFNFSSAWRAPAVSELYSDGLHHGAAALEYGDPNLKTERSLQTILGVERQTDKLFLEAGIYYNYMRNFIYLQPSLPPELTIRGAFPVFYYQQTDAAIYGLDASVHYQLNIPLLLTGKLSLLRARDLINDKWVVMMPADKVSGKVAYQFGDNGKWQNMYADVAVEHVFKQTRTYADEDYVDAPDAYTLTNISIGSDLQFNSTKLAWSIEADNLFNVAYRDYLNRFRYFADDMGRNITLRIKIPFTI